MHTSLINFSKTGYFSKLISEYLDGADSIKPFYRYPPALESFASVIKDKQKETINRPVLVEVLKEQYANLPNATSSLQQIESLLRPNTFTVTTGHQLCLFTGPLYFIYKIISTINLAEELRKGYPDNHFVPVYWMASEDHDFEEVSRVNVFGKKIVWNQEQKGATGKIATHSLQTVLEELKPIMGVSENALQLYQIFEEAYSRPTLALASSYLVHALLGQYGLVIIDVDDARLKAEFKDIIRDDILHETNYQLVNSDIQKLAGQHIKAQVNPRAINCFYMIEGQRERIEKKESYFHVVNTDIRFTEEELLQEVDMHPERFSPNVVLRPLYQEKILPNLAYIGGPGELAYWMEYKSMFEHHSINFPILMLRNCLLWIEAGIHERLQKLNINNEALFLPVEEQIKIFLNKQGTDISFIHEENQLKDLYETIKTRAEKIDPTLKATVEAELQKQLNALKTIESKLLKAEKQKQEVTVNQLRKMKEKLFPEGNLQERYDNMIPFYIKYGTAFFAELKANLNPFEKKFIVLSEE